MARLIHMSEAASLAVHGALLLASPEGRRWTVRELAKEVAASEAHFYKVIQRLAHQGLVRSIRGPGGGVELTRPPETISFLEIYEAVEGPLSPAGCLLGRPSCPVPGCCFDGLLEAASAQIEDYLAHTTLGEYWRRSEGQGGGPGGPGTAEPG